MWDMDGYGIRQIRARSCRQPYCHTGNLKLLCRPNGKSVGILQYCTTIWDIIYWMQHEFNIRDINGTVSFF